MWRGADGEASREWLKNQRPVIGLRLWRARLIAACPTRAAPLAGARQTEAYGNGPPRQPTLASREGRLCAKLEKVPRIRVSESFVSWFVCVRPAKWIVITRIVNKFIDSLTHWLLHSIHSQTNWMIDAMNEWLNDWMNGCSGETKIRWLMGHFLTTTNTHTHNIQIVSWRAPKVSRSRYIV